MATKTKRRPRFRRKPKIVFGTMMGDALAWFDQRHEYRIIRFPEFEGGVERYYVARFDPQPYGGRWLHLDNHPGPCRQLTSAIAACEQHLMAEVAE